jgi:hypothetical protein
VLQKAQQPLFTQVITACAENKALQRKIHLPERIFEKTISELMLKRIRSRMSDPLLQAAFSQAL